MATPQFLQVDWEEEGSVVWKNSDHIFTLQVAKTFQIEPVFVLITHHYESEVNRNHLSVWPWPGWFTPCSCNNQTVFHWRFSVFISSKNLLPDMHLPSWVQTKMSYRIQSKDIIHIIWKKNKMLLSYIIYIVWTKITWRVLITLRILQRCHLSWNPVLVHLGVIFFFIDSDFLPSCGYF